MKLGLLGEKLGHSLSPAIHDMALKALGVDGNYGLIEVPTQGLADFMQSFKDGAYDGINVTIPYKREVIQYLDALSDGAARIGAVNTILREGKTLKGFNTDYDGFGALLAANFIDTAGEDFVVLGAGGAANSVLTYLSDHAAGSITLVSRSPESAERGFSGKSFAVPFKTAGYVDLNLEGKILVNTTPVGMHPKEGVSPIPADALNGCKTLVDLIYNPAQTRLMQDAITKGIPAVNGLYMLAAQAMKAEEIWQGRAMDGWLTRQIYNSLSQDKPNIVITGMPGSGKTTVGKLVAEQLNMDFFDMDADIEARFGDIHALFAKGEEHFRDIEFQTAAAAANRTNTVVCTGGGVVKRNENMKHLAGTGAIFFLDRPVEQIYGDVDADSRPLLKQDKSAVFKLYEERIGLYQKFSHCRIANETDAETAAAQIIEKWRV